MSICLRDWDRVVGGKRAAYQDAGDRLNPHKGETHGLFSRSALFSAAVWPFDATAKSV